MKYAIMPAFVFERRRDIELECGLLLAGMLTVDIPKNTKPKRRHRRMINDILAELLAIMRSRQMPDATDLIVGWPGGFSQPMP
jgi:hypothetical protein